MMDSQRFLLLVCLTMCGRDIESASEIRLPDHQSRSSHVQNRYSIYASRRPSVPYTVIHPSRTGSLRENPRTITAEVLNPQGGCTGGGCHGSQRPANNHTKECKGIGCKLPVRMRQDPKQHSCVGDACSTGSDAGRSRLSFVHMQDRAEQVSVEFPELGTQGGPSSGIQLTCDIKPGTNEVNSEDALVLHLHLAKGQDKLVAQLHGQQEEVKQIQSALREQQSALLAHQREILDQQRIMFDKMDEVKTQYSLLLDSVKQLTVVSPQGGIESHLEGLQSQVRTYSQEAFTMHKMNMDASVTDADRPLIGCGSCQTDEYCDFSAEKPRCERCTVCPPGFFLVAQCSTHSDRICQDRDECLEIPNLCKEHNQCLNTPGGFRCSDMSERLAAAGICGHSYFYNSEMEECQACTECDSQPMISPCSAVSDAVCANPSESKLSLSWSGSVDLPKGSELTDKQLHIRGNSDGRLLSCTDGWIVLYQHGLVWVDHNLALKHGCRSFVQACLRLNASEDGGRDLSGMRLEQRDTRSLQSASVSGATAVEPGHILYLSLKSATNQCSQNNDDVHLQGSLLSPFSLLWLSHDTGAVAMTAQAVASAHYHTNYRPAFRTSSISDPYVVSLTHDNRGVRFRESGTVKFVLQQALYSMGQACISEGFYLLAYLNRNGSSAELTRAFKPGVHYRDTSISLSAATTVDSGDMLTFEILAPTQCNVRYFGDDSGISILSLLWIPSSMSTALSASVSRKGLPTGAVRNKALFFHQTTTSVKQVALAGTKDHRDFIFREAGTASVALDLRLIHSCSLIKLTLLQQNGSQGVQPAPVAQQIGGQMPEGSLWASVGLRVSFQVLNGTVIFATVDCVRGRINQIAYDAGSSISILWAAA
ncbi:uncharacterized protein si:ch211-252f13.5 [Danio rerio]|uniref:Si:ch211-252f13.5 n=1 Tax=Danio rerio TaxID=7955 RepID=X1WBF6_DANRE|nr:uncharacterized protein si:ch211-252f13.5 [Danio rerio]|eukprot:XP_005171244.1 uncharacterized protein si:ch211-252f13.5 [Danio rerio]